MKTIKAIAVGFLSVFAISSADAQVVKVKKYPDYYGDPRIKIKNDDDNVVIKAKGYGGYYKNRTYYYDANRHLYYHVYNGKNIYYRKGWIPY